MTSKNKKLTALFTAGCVVVLIVAVSVWFSSKGVTLGKSDEICEGVTVNGIDVGGLTRKQAEKKIDTLLEELLKREVTITIDENEISASAETLGFSCEKGDIIEKAYQIGKEGNFFGNYQKLSDEDKEKGKLELDCKVDEVQLGKFVEENCTSFVVKAKNSKLKYENGKFTATKSREGRVVKVDETVAVISHTLLKDVGTEPLTVSAVVDVSKPKYTQEQVAKCQDLIGSYSTYYGTSTAARANNVNIINSQSIDQTLEKILGIINKSCMSIKLINDIEDLEDVINIIINVFPSYFYFDDTIKIF